MKDEQNQHQENKPLTGKGHGPQGVDKAPGEEVSQDDEQFTQQTQKGKKVDGDPELESDKPAGQSL